MNITLGKTHTKKINEFSKLITIGLESWVKAGELLVEMVDENENTYANILESIPEMSYEVLSRFEQIGRKQLNPRLLLDGSTGLRKLATLPFSEQNKYYEEPMDVLIETGKGTDTLKVMARDLTPGQCKQVFKNGTLRDLGAQRSWLRSQKDTTIPVTIADGNAYTVKGGKVIFHRACVLSMKDMATLMAQMS